MRTLIQLLVAVFVPPAQTGFRRNHFHSLYKNAFESVFTQNETKSFTVKGTSQSIEKRNNYHSNQ